MQLYPKLVHEISCITFLKSKELLLGMQLFVGKSGRWCIGVSGEQFTVNKFFICDGSWGELTWSPTQSGNCLENSGIQMY